MIGDGTENQKINHIEDNKSNNSTSTSMDFDEQKYIESSRWPLNKSSNESIIKKPIDKDQDETVFSSKDIDINKEKIDRGKDFHQPIKDIDINKEKIDEHKEKKQIKNHLSSKEQNENKFYKDNRRQNFIKEDNNFKSISVPITFFEHSIEKGSDKNNQNLRKDNQENDIDKYKLQNKIYFDDILKWVKQNSNNNKDIIENQDSENVSSQSDKLKYNDSDIRGLKFNESSSNKKKEHMIDYEISVGSININIEDASKMIEPKSVFNQKHTYLYQSNRLKRSFLRIK